MSNDTYYQRNKERLRQKQRDWRAAHRQEHRKYQAEYMATKGLTTHGRAQRLIAAAKSRSEKPCDLTTDWLQEKLERGRCEVSGLPLVLVGRTGQGWGTKHPFSPSLDQKVAGLGYTKENTQVVCWIYNIAKSHWSHEEVMKLALALTTK
jgi:hypothetical protein